MSYSPERQDRFNNVIQPQRFNCSLYQTSEEVVDAMLGFEFCTAEFSPPNNVLFDNCYHNIITPDLFIDEEEYWNLPDDLECDNTWPDEIPILYANERDRHIKNFVDAERKNRKAEADERQRKQERADREKRRQQWLELKKEFGS